MNMNGNERKKPFSILERELFLNIIQKYDPILSSRQTNTVSAIKKKHCWEKIKHEFNSSSIIIQPATIKQLTKLWYNMKAKASIVKKKENDRYSTGDEQKKNEKSTCKIDELKYKILEDELDFKQKLHTEELKLKKMEYEYREKILHIELQIKEQQLKKIKESEI